MVLLRVTTVASWVPARVPARLLHPGQLLLMINLLSMDLREPPDGKHLLKGYLNKVQILKNQILLLTLVT